MRPNEQTKCDLCGSKSAMQLWSRGRYGIAVNNVVCNGCGLIYVCPQPTKSEIDEFYKNEEFTKQYRNLKNDTEEKINQRIQVAEEWHVLINGIKKHDLRSGHIRLLEIGSGIGAISGYFSTVGFSVIAIEPDPSFIASAAERYPFVKYVQTDFDDYHARAAPNGEVFDCILMIHMLEHVPSPREILVKVRSLLKYDGLVAIEVPCAECPYGAEGLDFFFMRPHLYTFSIQTLSSYLHITGYKVLKAQYHGPFLRMLAQKGERDDMIQREDAAVVKERLISWHRRQCRKRLIVMPIRTVRRSRWLYSLLHYAIFSRIKS